ncbi:translation initiation factor IF-2-like [Lutra lutra]|uniref:translation initiation factor IF-2-like n=1 Tax=Lutra lutra TaxID=9657 RepID=UPI001FD197BD|nr:translation initiation factor IF-2-like [Lutra lutra]
MSGHRPPELTYCRGSQISPADTDRATSWRSPLTQRQPVLPTARHRGARGQPVHAVAAWDRQARPGPAESRPALEGGTTWSALRPSAAPASLRRGRGSASALLPGPQSQEPHGTAPQCRPQDAVFSICAWTRAASPRSPPGVEAAAPLALLSAGRAGSARASRDSQGPDTPARGDRRSAHAALGSRATPSPRRFGRRPAAARRPAGPHPASVGSVRHLEPPAASDGLGCPRIPEVGRCWRHMAPARTPARCVIAQPPEAGSSVVRRGAGAAAGGSPLTAAAGWVGDRDAAPSGFTSGRTSPGSPLHCPLRTR